MAELTPGDKVRPPAEVGPVGLVSRQVLKDLCQTLGVDVTEVTGIEIDRHRVTVHRWWSDAKGRRISDTPTIFLVGDA